MKVSVDNDDDRLTWVFQDSAMLSRHQGALWWLVLRLEIVADVFHLDPFDAFFGVKVFD